ncbi:alpha-ribazole phosphatase CobZ [Candidatus Geothermarchaeota archaeon]|nr:MAG: alpha-ribazole phosphatase CobZ [Candidatus Geothermarchaeota archaeon]
MKSCESSGYSPSRDLLKRLSERGIDMETLVEASLKLFIPWKGMNREKARKTIRKYLKLLSRDPNISSLVMASARLDEDARIGLIPGLSKEDYLKDPVYLVADEILGMALALYINGWNGLFEYYRYDREKPGVIKRLPPFMDDVIAAFIAGVTSRIYSKGLEERP